MDSTKTKQRKVIAAHEMQLPWELIEEILSRVSPSSLVRFKTVCKRWNAILDDKTFINNHKETFRFIITTGSKLHSVSIDPKLVVRELTLGIPGLEYENPRYLFDCDEFVLCSMDKGAVVWNPWLKLSRCISQPNYKFQVIGCDSNRRSEESIYKTIWCNTGRVDRPPYLKIHDLASCTWKDASVEFSGGSSQEKKRKLITRSGVSLNGTLFWISFSDKTDPLYQLVTFDFSSEVFYIFCDLPCGKSHPCDALVLWVFERDRFSVLKQCHITKKIEIWVTKNKVDVKDGNDVVWMSFMTFSIPNFPNLVSFRSYYQQPSYFIDDKRLVVCSCDENGQPWIYILGENKLIRKVQLDSIVGFWPSHCTYFPSLVPVPREKG